MSPLNWSSYTPKNSINERGYTSHGILTAFQKKEHKIYYILTTCHG
jgi:hypothetical protein